MAGYLIDANDPAARSAWYRIDAPIPKGLGELSIDGLAGALEFILEPAGVWADQVIYHLLGNSIYLGGTNNNPTWPDAQAAVVAADLDELLAAQFEQADYSYYPASPFASAQYQLASADPLAQAQFVAAFFTVLAERIASQIVDPAAVAVTVSAPGVNPCVIDVTFGCEPASQSAWDINDFGAPE